MDTKNETMNGQHETSVQPLHKRFVMKEQFNFNTILLTIVLGIGAWSLKETISQGRDFVELKTKMENMQYHTDDARRRITAVEATVVLVQIELAKLKKLEENRH